MHRPGIEPGSREWESRMIPLHQRCHASVKIDVMYIFGENTLNKGANLFDKSIAKRELKLVSHINRWYNGDNASEYLLFVTSKLQTNT